MSGSVNKVIIVGNLGKDPEVRLTQYGKKIANLSVATKESWTDKETGTKKEQTEWHRIVIFNENLADIASKYIKKGDRIYIEGQLHTRKWTDNTGTEHVTTEITLPKFGGELVMLNTKTTHHVGGEDFSAYNYADEVSAQKFRDKNLQEYEEYSE